MKKLIIRWQLFIRDKKLEVFKNCVKLFQILSQMMLAEKIFAVKARI